jgi:hypothetical protein
MLRFPPEKLRLTRCWQPRKEEKRKLPWTFRAVMKFNNVTYQRIETCLTICCVPNFLKSFVNHPPSPRSKNFENFPTSNSNNSITTRSFEILKTQLNPACKDEQIGNFSFFLIPFPDLDKRVESVNLAYFSRKLLVNCSYS